MYLGEISNNQNIPIYACQIVLVFLFEKFETRFNTHPFLKLRVVINEDILLVLETVWGKKKSKAKELGKFSGSKRDLYLSIYQATIQTYFEKSGISD